jgi:hypothetical protein
VPADELRLHADKGAKLRANVGVQVRGVDVVRHLKLVNRASASGLGDRLSSRSRAIPVTVEPAAVPITVPERRPTLTPLKPTTVPIPEPGTLLTPLRPTTIIPTLITTTVITPLETAPIPTTITVTIKPATTAAALVAVTLLVGGTTLAIGPAVPVLAARA